jgi:hypothetical protein
MKQKDIALIIVIAAIGAIVSLFVSKLIFTTPANRQQQVDLVPSISVNFPNPDPAYFNSSSTDPTKQISISKSANSNPF